MNLLIRDKLLALHFRGKQRFLDVFDLESDISCWNMCWVRGKQAMAGITPVLMSYFGFSKWKVLFVLEFVLKWFFLFIFLEQAELCFCFTHILVFLLRLIPFPHVSCLVTGIHLHIQQHSYNHPDTETKLVRKSLGGVLFPTSFLLYFGFFSFVFPILYKN